VGGDGNGDGGGGGGCRVGEAQQNRSRAAELAGGSSSGLVCVPSFSVMKSKVEGVQVLSSCGELIGMAGEGTTRGSFDDRQ
jgi:hypothetical protein